MLQNIRDKSSSWVVKVIVGFIILTFALFGVDAIVGAFTGGGDEVATVNDEKISRYELEIATQRQVRQTLAEMGPDADPSQLNENLIRQRALQGLISREAMLQAAKDAGLSVSELQIDRLILATKEFQDPQGTFSAEQFNLMLQNIGMAPAQFREELRTDMLINQYQGGIGLSEFMPEKYVERVIALDSQTRDLTFVTLDASAQKGIEITDAEIETYYQNNQEAFRQPERVQLDYIRVSQQDLLDRIEVTDSELQSAYSRYEQRIANQASYYASHILLETETRSEEEAIAALEAIRARVEQGESFAELAKTESEDIGSAADGGKLGLVEPGSFDADFEQALFALEEGGVSEPVMTEFGVHLVYLDKKETAERVAFDEMRDTLVTDIRADKAAKEYVLLTEELANATFAADNLQVPAEELKLKVARTGFFSEQGGEGIASHPAVIRAAFSDLVKNDGENSDLIELDSGSAVVIRAADVKPSAISPLETVAERIRARLTLEKQVAAVETLAQELIAASDEASLEAVAASRNLKSETVSDVSRVEQALPAAVIRQAFSQPESAVEKVVAGDKVYLVQVTGIAQPEMSDEIMAFYQQAIRLSQARNSSQQLRAATLEQADITRL